MVIVPKRVFTLARDFLRVRVIVDLTLTLMGVIAIGTYALFQMVVVIKLAHLWRTIRLFALAQLMDTYSELTIARALQ